MDTGPHFQPRSAPPGHEGCSGVGERSPHRHHLPPARPQLSITSAASIHHPTDSGGTRPPDLPAPPSPAPSTYCCRGCRSRTVAAGRGGSAAPCSAFSPASRLSSHNKGSEGEAGGCRPRRGLAGSRAIPPARPRSGSSSARGAQGRRCWLAMAVRPASRLCLAGGSRALRPPHAATPAPRGAWGGEVGMVALWAQGCEATCRASGNPGANGGTREHPPLPQPHSPPHAPGMPQSSQTSTAEGCPAPRPLLVSLLRRSQHLGSLPRYPQKGLTQLGMGRQGLNCPPHLRIAKGNTKCQSHQPQYVSTPAKRSACPPPARTRTTALVLLVQQHPKPLSSPTSCPAWGWAQPR